MRRSRLKTNIRNQNKKTLIGIIIILILVAFFGMKFLVSFSVVLEKLKSSKDTSLTSQSINYVAPPTLNPLPQATKDGKVDVLGYTSSENLTVKLYLNNTFYEKTVSGKDNKFSFTNVSLSAGKNEIKAKVESSDKKQSDFSITQNISYLNNPPSLEVSSIHDGESFKKDESPITVSGKTDKGAKVTINDFWAITNDDGTFSYRYSLKDGDNTIKIVATDDAGNKTEKDFNIKTE